MGRVCLSVHRSVAPEYCQADISRPIFSPLTGVLHLFSLTATEPLVIRLNAIGVLERVKMLWKKRALGQFDSW